MTETGATDWRTCATDWRTSGFTPPEITCGRTGCDTRAASLLGDPYLPDRDWLATCPAHLAELLAPDDDGGQ